ncbi:hypothetical protein C8A01DRAFT_37518 [Parachaetomium inaequale]|uniref:Uncharacterized protein n=1 Tax=Parachaetomium inaequale TaxID=2588326 RepID=A0AAN6PCV1_9PEZI|nr:hypothetical protein C8A01DRAFT_37518 [Parachaetomium inaequale]
MARLAYKNNNRTAAPKPTITTVCNEQVQRFVLLAPILEAAGLTPEEVKTCMAKYVAGLSAEKASFLLFDLPKVEEINIMGPLSDMAIANLSDGNMSVEAVTRAVQQAKLRFVESPESGHGEKGWLRELLHALAGEAKQGEQAGAKAWFNNPDCALWLAIMARVQLVLSVEQWRSQLPEAVRDAYRDGWLGAFGVQREVSGVERRLPASSAPASATAGWSGAIKVKSTTKKSSKPAAVAAANRSFLTREFFASQTENPPYLSLIKEIPSVVKKTANELRQQLSLPQIALEKPQATNSKVHAGNSKAQKKSQAQKSQAQKSQAQKPQAQKPQAQQPQAQQPRAETGNSKAQAETSKQEYYNTWPEVARKPQAQQPQAQTGNSKAQTSKQEYSCAEVARKPQAQQPEVQEPQAENSQTQTVNSKAQAEGGKQIVSRAAVARMKQGVVVA